MRTLELKILPDAVAIIVAVCMWIVSLTVVPFRLPVTMRVAGVILIVVGLGVVQLAGVSFRRARTTVDPTKPGAASVLVVSGLYHFSRNPMYLGMALVLFGWAFFLLNALSIAFVALFVFYIDRFQIVPEERALSALFGTEYDSYRAGVRRWL
jgi:protein-S-isoprenylcysteine O-methyltransferase Ste14